MAADQSLWDSLARCRLISNDLCGGIFATLSCFLLFYLVMLFFCTVLFV